MITAIERSKGIVMVWSGPLTDRNRKLAVYGPCPCGCSPGWYLSGSKDGHGVSVLLDSEEVARNVAAAFGLELVTK